MCGESVCGVARSVRMGATQVCRSFVPTVLIEDASWCSLAGAHKLHLLLSGVAGDVMFQ